MRQTGLWMREERKRITADLRVIVDGLCVDIEIRFYLGLGRVNRARPIARDAFY